MLINFKSFKQQRSKYIQQRSNTMEIKIHIMEIKYNGDQNPYNRDQIQWRSNTYNGDQIHTTEMKCRCPKHNEIESPGRLLNLR